MVNSEASMSFLKVLVADVRVRTWMRAYKRRYVPMYVSLFLSVCVCVYVSKKRRNVVGSYVSRLFSQDVCAG